MRDAVNDPLRQRVEIETPDNVVVTFEIAGLGRRSLATAIDMLVMAGLSFLLALVAGAALLISGTALADLAGLVVGGLLVANLAIWWTYFLVCELTMNGQSIGKRRLKIRVVRLDGGEVTFLHSAIRNLLRGADGLPFAYGVGSLCALLTQRSQRLGDLLAGTIVVVQDPEAPPEYLLVDLDRLPLPEDVRGAILARVSAVKQEEYDYAVRLLTRLPAYYLVHPADAEWLAMQTAGALLAKLQLQLDRPLDYVLSVSVVQCVVAAYGRRAAAR